MDIVCPVCGEPWDFDSLHEEAQERYGIPYYIYDDGYTTLSYNARSRELNPEYNSEDYQKVYKVVSAEFRSKGCKALKHLTDATYCKPQKREGEDLTRAEAASVLYDLLGDDMDGAAAMLEDFEMGY